MESVGPSPSAWQRRAQWSSSIIRTTSRPQPPLTKKDDRPAPTRKKRPYAVAKSSASAAIWPSQMPWPPITRGGDDGGGFQVALGRLQAPSKPSQSRVERGRPWENDGDVIATIAGCTG